MSFLGNIFSPPKPPPAPDYAGAAQAQSIKWHSVDIYYEKGVGL